MNNFSNYNSNQMSNGDFNNNYQNQNQMNFGYSNENMGNGGNVGNMGNMGNMGGMTNMNNPDMISLNSNNFNGTTLNELSGDNKYEDNNSLIKSLTKEIINNLKENNIDIYDNLSKKYDDFDSDSSSKKKKKKKKKSKENKDLDDEVIKEELQDYVLDSNPVPATNSFLSSIFDGGFEYKDFLILFILYFILSQEMIKDFFAKYFTCLNPDDEGKINIQGVIVYGLILTIFFILLKKLF